MINIQYVNFGLGHVIDGRIYLNKRLKNNPELKKIVLEHELKHIDGVDHVDWNEPFNLKLFLFCIAHPSTWIHFDPIWIIIFNDPFRIRVSINKFMLGWWCIVSAIICLFLWVNLWILK